MSYKRHIRLIVLGAVAMLAALAASAYGASADSGPVAKAAAGTPIKVGVLYDATGAVSSSGAGFGPAAAAWASYTNAHGGIGGHPVKLTTIDAKSSSTAAVTAARALKSAGVVAVLPGMAETSAVAPFFKTAKIPAVGGTCFDDTPLKNSNFFSACTTADNLAAGIVTAGNLGHKGKNWGVVYCTEVSSCSETLPLIGKTVAAQGGKVVWRAGISGSAPGYAAQCLAAKKANVDTIWLNVAPATGIRIAQDCASQGYKAHWGGGGGAISNLFLKVPALNGFTFPQTVLPYYSGQPASKLMLAAMKKYQPKALKSASFGDVTTHGWASGALLVAALNAVKANKIKNVKSADVYRGLYALKRTTLGGLTPPLTFNKGKPTSIKCVFLSQIKSGKFVILRNGKTIC